MTVKQSSRSWPRFIQLERVVPLCTTTQKESRMNVRILSQLLRLTFAVALFTLMPLVSASAAPFSPITQSGVFAADDAHGLVPFNLASDQTLYFYTTSYAGGPNADGTSATSGGFDPVVTLFDSTNTYVSFNDDDTVNYNRPKNGTGSSLDA